MDPRIAAALRRSQVIDLTTTGRRTHEPRRIEIFLHADLGRLFITGQPRPATRAWIHNIAADPHVTLHLKRDVHADVPSIARVIDDPTERRPLIESAAARWGRHDVERMMAQSPLIVVEPVENTPR
jgi:deazaflavin-dependent oxidoreductase (nitroreductase family)